MAETIYVKADRVEDGPAEAKASTLRLIPALALAGVAGWYGGKIYGQATATPWSILAGAGAVVVLAYVMGRRHGAAVGLQEIAADAAPPEVAVEEKVTSVLDGLFRRATASVG